MRSCTRLTVLPPVLLFPALLLTPFPQLQTCSPPPHSPDTHRAWSQACCPCPSLLLFSTSMAMSPHVGMANPHSRLQFLQFLLCFLLLHGLYCLVIPYNSLIFIHRQPLLTKTKGKDLCRFDFLLCPQAHCNNVWL